MNRLPTLPQARPIFDMVDRTRRLLRVTTAGSGVCATVGALLGTLTLAVVIDWFMPLDTVGRAVALGAIVTLTIATYVLGVVRPAAQPLDASRVARRMERHLPGIRNRLVSCIELLGNSPQPAYSYSLAFEERLIGETFDRVRQFDPRVVVDWRAFQQMLAFALAGLLGLGLLVLFRPAATGVAIKRILAPWADLPPITAVAYRVVPGNFKLLRGDEFAIRAHVEHGQPSRLQVEIRPENGGAMIRYDLNATPTNTWQFTLTGYERPFQYRVVGGGTWSKTYRVAVLDRPNIVAVQTVLHYPDYLQPVSPLVSAAQVPDVTGPEGSQVEVVAVVQGDVATGRIERLETGTNGVTSAGVALPMERSTNDLWRGRFLLTSNGVYRVEFQNELGHANKPMTPARFVALPDKPPQVVIERPGTDVSLSPTGKLPVALAVSDDYGLAALTLLVGPPNTNAELRVTLKKYATNQTTDAILHTLDLASYKLKVGESLRYKAEVRDRKGQTAQTGEFFVRVTAPEQSAEQNLVKLDDQQQAAVRKLTDLIAAQDAVRIKLDGLSSRYDALLDKLENAAQEAELRPAPDVSGATESLSPTNLAAIAKQSLNPIELKQLQGLQTRLAELARVQQLNAQQAQQFATELRQAADMAAAMPLMPLAMSEQMRALQHGFEQMVAQPMQQLANALQQSGSPQGLPVDPQAMSEYSEQVQENMSALDDSLQELTATTKQFSDNPSEALRALQEAQLRTQARLSERELAALQDQLGTMTDEMKRLLGAQESLAEQTTQVDTNELAAAARQQAALEKELAPLLQAVRDLQAAGRLPQMRRRPPPTFPGAPYTPDNPEALLPPKEEDVEEAKEEDRRTPEERAAQLREQLQHQLDEALEEEEPSYHPVLSDEQPKLNPRFANKQRPGRKPLELPMPFGQQQQELQSRQTQRLQELDMANQSVSADQQVLNAVAQQLQQALSGPADPQGLRQAMQKPEMNQALAMAARMQQMMGQAGQGQMNRLPRMGGWSMYGGGMVYMGQLPANAKVPELNVTARTVILNMQPKMREELLQGMQEQGPAPYQPYIRQYFEQLTKVKEPK